MRTVVHGKSCNKNESNGNAWLLEAVGFWLYPLTNVTALFAQSLCYVLKIFSCFVPLLRLSDI